MRPGPRGTDCSSAHARSGAPPSSRSATRATIRPRRSCCGCSGAPGPRGLAAMHPRNGSIVRPLLSCRRHELRAYLAERQTPYVEDESNADVSIPRNRVRAELLPWLEQRFNPGIVDVLADEADLAREVWQWMEAEADGLITKSEVSRSQGSSLTGSDFRPETSHFDVPILMAAPLALRRFVVWRAMTDAAAGRAVAFAHVEAALRMLESEDAAPVDVPGHRLERQGQNLVLTSRPPGAPGTINAVGRRRRGIRQNGEALGKAANFFEYPLSIPGEVPVPAAGCILSAEAGPVGVLDPRAVSSDRVAVVRRDLCTGPLADQEPARGRLVPASGTGGPEEAAGLLRGPESDAAQSRYCSAGRRRNRPDCVGGGLRN